MNKVLIIGGPTGIGKSDVAVQLALRYNAIIIGADSMQIYKDMDIGTGKIREDEKCGIRHTMIDIVMPNEEYSVQKYCHDAKNIIATAHANQQLPIVVGGTGLYINALINEQNFANAQPDAQLRERYSKLYREHGAQYMHDLLRNVDEASAQKIAVNDVKRIIRALEIHAQTGKGKSACVTAKKSPYDICFCVLQTDRSKLYEKINKRVDAMFARGLVDEVQSLQAYRNCRSMQAIGYKEILAALRENRPVCETIDEIKQNSRHYAKRQITFFKWIQSPKMYIDENFFENITNIADVWLNEENI